MVDDRPILHPERVPVTVAPVAAGAPDVIARAADALVRGGVLVLPTDTVYGVGVAATVEGATAKLFAAKDRPSRQAVAVLVADRAQAEQLGVLEGPAVPPGLDGLLAEAWPGPLTVVVARTSAAAGLDLGGAATTVGLRCPDHELVRALARRVGPLATTSANRHGAPTPELAAEAAGSLAVPADLVIDGGRCAGDPSTVVDCTRQPPMVLRQGAFPAERLAAHLGLR